MPDPSDDIQMSSETLNSTLIPSVQQSQRKRMRSQSPEASSSRSKKARMGKAVLSPKKHKTPKKPHDWHLKKEDVPENSERTKVALELHIRILWQLPHQNAIPPSVTNIEKANFDQRFDSEQDIRSSVHDSLNRHAGNINEAQSAVSKLLRSLQVADRGLLVNNIRRMTEHNLVIMFRTVASFGLSHWAPDILGSDPDSMYNLLHENIALITFEQVASAYGYSHMGINLSFVKNFVLMRKFYRSFVFSYMQRRAKLEAKSPGSVSRNTEITNVYKRRSELAIGRADTLKAQGFNERTVALALETEAHSDDEFAESETPKQVYYIKVKDGRSVKVKEFFRMTDVLRRNVAQRKGKNRSRSERHREDPTPPKASELTTLPQKVPIDWFDPQFWNTLTVRERANYIKDGYVVALPLAAHCQTWEQCNEWKNLPEDEFMEKYGDAVLVQYNLPTDEEMKQLEQWDDEEEEEDEVEEVADNLDSDEV